MYGADEDAPDARERTMTLWQMTPVIAHHGEGAYWDAKGAAWLSVDMLTGRVLVTSPTGQTGVIDLPDRVAAGVRPVESGDLLIVGEKSVWVFSRLHEQFGKLIDLPIAEGVRANEMALAPDGSVVVGTMAYDPSPGTGSVLHIDSSGAIEVVLSGTHVSNGMVYFNEDHVAFVDSPTQTIRGFQIMKDGSWSSPTVLVDLSKQPGIPDGICMDAAGGIWVALWGGGQVQRWSKEGVLTDVVHLPVSQPTSVALGGPDLRTLAITTSSFGLEEGSERSAGAMFVLPVHTPGVPLTPIRQEFINGLRSGTP